jgi:arsenate reductase
VIAKRRVLFLCTGNSARSQIAEAVVNHFLGDRWEAHSAGTAPVGFVHPLAVEVLAEWGIAIASLRSKSVEELRGVAFDLVVTLCDDAAEQCPVWMGPGDCVHVGFPDPSRTRGQRTDRLMAFQDVRDRIREMVFPVLFRREGTTTQASAPEAVHARSVS